MIVQFDNFAGDAISTRARARDQTSAATMAPHNNAALTTEMVCSPR
jgi:hypothetical protein